MLNTIDGGATTTHLDDALCADLVLGLRPGPEREAMLAHVRTCAACEARLRAHVGAAERARADAPGTAGRETALPRRHAWAVPALTLALAAGLVGAVLLPRVFTPSRPASGVLALPAPGASVHSRAGEAEDPRLDAGLRAWERHELAAASRELGAAKASGAQEQLRRLYLADARLAEGDAGSAVALLHGVEWRTVPEPWRRAGVTLLARALRARGEDATADSIERALRTLDPGTPLLP